MEGRPWAEYGKARKPITKNQLAKLLDSFKVNPAGTVRFGSQTAKGYYRNQFEESSLRYLAPHGVSELSQRHNACGTSTSEPFRNVTAEDHVAVQKCEKPASNGHCDGVTFENGDNTLAREDDGIEGENSIFEDDLSIPALLKRCAQCNAGGDDLESHRDGNQLAYLHPECARFWKGRA